MNTESQRLKFMVEKESYGMMELRKPKDGLHLQVTVDDPIFMEVFHCCQHLVDHHAGIFLSVDPSFQDPVEQLSARHPVEEKGGKSGKSVASQAAAQQLISPESNFGAPRSITSKSLASGVAALSCNALWPCCTYSCITR